MEQEPLKIYSLEELTDKHIGKTGTPKREAFDYELQFDILGIIIKKARKDRNLTKKELSKLVGVKKSQIFKLEKSLKNARFETIIKVLKALNAIISFNVEFQNQTFEIT